MNEALRAHIDTTQDIVHSNKPGDLKLPFVIDLLLVDLSVELDELVFRFNHAIDFYFTITSTRLVENNTEGILPYRTRQLGAVLSDQILIDFFNTFVEFLLIMIRRDRTITPYIFSHAGFKQIVYDVAAVTSHNLPASEWLDLYMALIRLHTFVGFHLPSVIRSWMRDFENHITYFSSTNIRIALSDDIYEPTIFTKTEKDALHVYRRDLFRYTVLERAARVMLTLCEHVQNRFNVKQLIVEWRLILARSSHEKGLRLTPLWRRASELPVNLQGKSIAILGRFKREMRSAELAIDLHYAAYCLEQATANVINTVLHTSESKIDDSIYVVVHHMNKIGLLHGAIRTFNIVNNGRIANLKKGLVTSRMKIDPDPQFEPLFPSLSTETYSSARGALATVDLVGGYMDQQAIKMYTEALNFRSEVLQIRSCVVEFLTDEVIMRNNADTEGTEKLAVILRWFWMLKREFTVLTLFNLGNQTDYASQGGHWTLQFWNYRDKILTGKGYDSVGKNRHTLARVQGSKEFFTSSIIPRFVPRNTNLHASTTLITEFMSNVFTKKSYVPNFNRYVQAVKENTFKNYYVADFNQVHGVLATTDNEQTYTSARVISVLSDLKEATRFSREHVYERKFCVAFKLKAVAFKQITETGDLVYAMFVECKGSDVLVSFESLLDNANTNWADYKLHIFQDFVGWQKEQGCLHSTISMVDTNYCVPDDFQKNSAAEIRDSIISHRTDFYGANTYKRLLETGFIAPFQLREYYVCFIFSYHFETRTFYSHYAAVCNKRGSQSIAGKHAEEEVKQTCDAMTKKMFHLGDNQVAISILSLLDNEAKYEAVETTLHAEQEGVVCGLAATKMGDLIMADKTDLSDLQNSDFEQLRPRFYKELMYGSCLF